MKRVVILLMLMVMGAGVSFGQEGDSQSVFPYEVKAWNRPITLTIENEPKIGEETILKLSVWPFSGEKKEVDIICDIPKEWEFINVGEYRIDKYYIKGEPNSRCRHCEYEEIDPEIEPEEEGHYYKKTPEGKYRGYCKYVRVHLWEGYMKQGEKKEFILKVRIPDDKRNEIYCTYDYDEHFEFDLGELDPPDWPYLNRRKWRGTEVKDGKRLVCTDIYEVTPNIRKREVLVDEGELPPILSELRVRTKYIPAIDPYIPYGSSQEIPLRYLVSTNIEAKEVIVTVRVSEELEFVDEGNYEVTKKDSDAYVKLYQGPMQVKETKAFYFKVRVSEFAKKDSFGRGEADVSGKIKLLTPDGRELETTDDSSRIRFFDEQR